MNPNLATFLVRAAAGALAFVLLGAPSCGHVLEDEGFDLWCGDQLCNWELEDGDIAKIPTWHAGDPGVELVGPNVAISQFAPRLGDGGCLRFEAVADVEELASVTLELDFYDDGTVNHEIQIPTSSWEPVSLLITEARWYDGVRFRVRKLGNGRAALAQIEVTTDDKCVEPPIELDPRAGGMLCDADLAPACASGICNGVELGICVGCLDAGDCAAGEVCGLEASGLPPRYQVHGACLLAGSHLLGERCQVGEECATGHCAQGVCSACAATADCTPGDTCAAATGVDVDHPAFLCTSGGVVAGGGYCLADDQCASGSCAGGGDLRVCQVDGRTCSEDADCYALSFEAEPPENRCLRVGVVDGRCD